MLSSLPAGLGHAGHVAPVRGTAQADPAEAELAVVGAGAPAALAAVYPARRELGLAPLLDLLGSLCHGWSVQSLLVRLLGVWRVLTRRVGALATFIALGLFLVALGLLVGLGVLLLELLEGGLLGLGALARLLLAPLLLLLGVLGLGGRARAALFGERHAEPQQELEGLLVGLRRRRDRHVEAADLVDRVVVDLREDELLADPHRVVPAAVEGARVEATEVADARDRDRDQPVEELPHARPAQRDGGADRHPVTDLEGGDRLLGAADVRLLARDHAELLHRGLERVARATRFADAHVERDLLHAGRPHRAGVAEAVDQLRQDLVAVVIAQARRRGRLVLDVLDLFFSDGCFHGGSQSIGLPVRRATRWRLPFSLRTTPTRVGLLSVGSSNITLEASIGPSFSMMPPA